jgi:hypothetical protein
MDYYSEYMKRSKILNTKRSNNPINKWANELNREFSKEVQITNEYMKKGPTFLDIRKYKSK